MGTLDILIHLLNFMAPAVVVGVILAMLTPIFMPKQAASRVLLAQAAINSVAGVVALTLGLWIFGRDGKMASYAALVMACATSQWVLLRK